MSGIATWWNGRSRRSRRAGLLIALLLLVGLSFSAGNQFRGGGSGATVTPGESETIGPSESTTPGPSAFGSPIAPSGESPGPSSSPAPLTSPASPAATPRPTPTPTPTPTPVADYSSDSFGRTVAPGSWGTDAQGHSYVISGTVAASNARVDGSAGLLTIPTLCDQMASSLPLNLRDFDFQFRVKLSSVSTSVGENRIRLLARTDTTTEKRTYDYEFALSAPTGGKPLEAYINRRVGAGNDSVVASNTSLGLAQDPSSYFWLKGEISGTTTVTLRLKIWKDGTAEPTAWSINATDTPTATQLQSAGSIIYAHYACSAVPSTASVDDTRIYRIGTPPIVATAAFSATETSGLGPLAVTFTDRSSTQRR